MLDRQKAGLLLFAGGAQFMLGLLFAETLYPNYSIALNYISDLGTGPDPSRTIFTASIIIFGLFGVAAAALMIRSKIDRVVPYLLLISALGAIGVGLINENHPPFHTIMATLAFGGGGLVALFSYRLVNKKLGYLSYVLGILTLLALVLMASKIYLGMGVGGMERLVFFPAITWLLGLGAILAYEGVENKVTGPAR
jgi:hypothetical membrane protein